jgi:hypothetical protein
MRTARKRRSRAATITLDYASAVNGDYVSAAFFVILLREIYIAIWKKLISTYFYQKMANGRPWQKKDALRNESTTDAKGITLVMLA